MGLTNFPNGFPNGLSYRNLPLFDIYSRNVYWVDSNYGQGGNGLRNKPFSTLQAAIDYIADKFNGNGRGMKIVMADDHSETVTGTSAITFDVSGLHILGLGHGKQRPRFLMDGAATVKAVVSAADVMIQNVEFAAGHADVATCFDLDAKGFHLLDCVFSDEAVNENFLSIITSGSTTDNVCDGLVIDRNYWYSPDAAAAHLLLQTGDVDVLFVRGNTVILPAGTACEIVDVAAGDDMQGVVIGWNYLQHLMTSGELLVSNDQSDNSGFIVHNRVRHGDTTTTHDLGIDGLGCALFDNLSASTASVSGFVLPAIDVDN